MKQLNLFLALLLTLLLGAATTSLTYADRPNSSGIRGTVLILDPLPSPLPRVHVEDDHGRVIADVEVARNGSSGLFEIPLKKAGTYIVWAYYPPFPGALRTQVLITTVPRKEFTTVTLEWQSN